MADNPATPATPPVPAPPAQAAPAPRDPVAESVEAIRKGGHVTLSGGQEHGAAVVLNREASAAARGAAAPTQAGNILIKRALEASGRQADGHSPDGTSVTGKRQADDVLAERTDDPAGPPTGVKAGPDSAAATPAGLSGTTHTPTPEGRGGPANAAPAPAKAPATPPAPAKP